MRPGYLNNPILFPRAAAGATVNQLITDFGRTTNLVSSSQFHAKAEDQNAIATQQDIVLAVDEAFYNTLETHALLQVAEDTVKTRQTLVDQVQALTDAKLRSDLDLSFSKVDLARAKLLLLESNNNYEASISTLSAILGYPDRQNFRTVEPEQQASAPPLLEPTQLIQKAMQQRPEIQAMQNEVTAAEKFGRSEHDLWWPTVNASGVVGQAPARDDHIPSWYGGVGVNINIPVFNGFLFNARAKSADLETEMKRKKLQDMEDNLARDVRNTLAGHAKGVRAADGDTATSGTGESCAGIGAGPVQIGLELDCGIQPGGTAEDRRGSAGHRREIPIPVDADHAGVSDGRAALNAPASSPQKIKQIRSGHLPCRIGLQNLL